MEVSVEEKGARRKQVHFLAICLCAFGFVEMQSNYRSVHPSIINHHAFVVSIASPQGVEYHAVASLVISQAHLLNLNTRPF